MLPVSGEPFLRALLRQLPNGSVNVFDRDLRYLLAEGRGLAQVGLRSEDLVGRTLDELFPRQAVDLVRPHYGQAFAGQDVEFDLPLGDMVFRVAAGPLRTDDGPITAIVAVAQDVTPLRRSEARRQAEEQRRERLLRMSRTLASEPDPQRVLHALLEEVLALFQGQLATVFRVDAAQQVLLPVASNMDLPERMMRTPLGVGLPGRAAATRAPVIVADYLATFGPGTDAARAGVRSGVGVPLLHEGTLMGAMAVGTPEPGAIQSSEDLALLEQLASVAASVLATAERTRLEGVLLAARTAEHELNNQLALTVGYAELLALDPRLPPHLRELAAEALQGAQQAAATVDRLQRITQVQETDLGGYRVLDLTRSTELPT